MCLVMILVKKVFIFSKTMIICLLCPLLCGLFFFWKGAKGELSYKVKKRPDKLYYTYPGIFVLRSRLYYYFLGKLTFMFHKKNLAYCTALKASSKSSMISSIFSVPIDRRIVLGLIPDPNNSSSVI